MLSSLGNFPQTNMLSLTKKTDESHGAHWNKVLDMTKAAARSDFLAAGMCLAAAVAALTGIWIPAWGGVSALLWDHYSDGQSLSYK